MDRFPSISLFPEAGVVLVSKLRKVDILKKKGFKRMDFFYYWILRIREV